jgi:hypothetical protein
LPFFVAYESITSYKIAFSFFLGCKWNKNTSIAAKSCDWFERNGRMYMSAAEKGN